MGDDDDQPRFEKFADPNKRRDGKRLTRTPENDCEGKARITKIDAKRLKRYGLRGYKCGFCKHWHVTSSFFKETMK